MKCTAIGAIRKNINYLPNFNGRNEVDYSKYSSESSRLDDNSLMTFDVNRNKYGQPLNYTQKIFKDGKMCQREFYNCTYYENGAMKKEKWVKQDFNNNKETISVIEYYPDCKVKNNDQLSRPLY